MAVHIIVVRPGAGYSPQNNKDALDRFAHDNGYTLETVGESHLGESYDRYPCEDVNGTKWGRGCARSPPDLERFTEELVVPLYIQRLEEGKRVVLFFGSRGGQVCLPALWRLGCQPRAIVINAGCCRGEVTPPADGGKLALVSCSDDYFPTRNPAVIEAWVAQHQRTNNTRVFILDGEGHMPTLTPPMLTHWCHWLLHT
jgi:hypothetical protein